MRSHSEVVSGLIEIRNDGIMEDWPQAESIIDDALDEITHLRDDRDQLRTQNAKLLAACEEAKYALETIGWGDDKWGALHEQLCAATKPQGAG